MNKRIIGRTLFLAMLCVIAPVWADEPTNSAASAEILYEQGKALANDKQWAKALTAFDGAMKLDRQPRRAGQLGRVHVELGNYVEGARNLEWFIREAVEVPIDVREGVRPTLEQAKANIATVMVTIDQPDAELRIDGQVVESKRLSWPQYLVSGTHVFEAKKVGFVTATETRKLTAGSTAEVALTMQAVATANQEGLMTKDKPDPKPMPTSVKAAWVVGGALAGIGIGTGIGAVVTYLPMKDAWYENECGMGCEPQFNSRRSLLEGLSRTALVSGALGAVVVGVAIYGTRKFGKEQVGFRLAPRMNGADFVVTW